MFGIYNKIFYGDKRDKKCFFCRKEAQLVYEHIFIFDGQNFVVSFNSHSDCYSGTGVTYKIDDGINLHTLNTYLAANNRSCIICDKRSDNNQFIRFLFPNDNFGFYVGRECGCKNIFFQYIKAIKSDIFVNLNVANLFLCETQDLRFQCGNIEKAEIDKAILFSRADYQRENVDDESKDY